MLSVEDRIDTAFFPYGPESLDGLIHNDHLGTPQKLTDSTGTVVWAADYKPFGEATITVSSITNNLRFPGQYYDQETGLNYNYFRDYNPNIGRYIEADKIGILKGQNHLYLYVRDNPIKFVDPYGLFIGGQTLPPTIFNPFDPNIWTNTEVFKAAWEEVKKTKECKYWMCTANCELKVVIGEITEELASKMIEEAAKKVAKEMVEKLIPYYNWYSISTGVYSGVRCFVDCHEK